MNNNFQGPGRTSRTEQAKNSDSRRLRVAPRVIICGGNMSGKMCSAFNF